MLHIYKHIKHPLWYHGDSCFCAGGHFGFLIRTKNVNFVEDHPMNIPAKNGFEKDQNKKKSLQTTLRMMDKL